MSHIQPHCSVQLEALKEKVRWHDITRHHDCSYKFSLHDSGNILGGDSKSPVVLGVDLLVLAKVLLVREQQQYIWLQWMFQFVDQKLSLPHLV